MTLMQALDHESFSFRAEFFGRTLAEELVGCIDGERGGEALLHLRQLAERRRERIEDIIARERARQGIRRRRLPRALLSSLESWYAPPSKPQTPRPPQQVFVQTECPICFATESLGAMQCGHMVCKACHEHMSGVTTLTCNGHVRCPQCRTPGAWWSSEALVSV